MMIVSSGMVLHAKVQNQPRPVLDGAVSGVAFMLYIDRVYFILPSPKIEMAYEM